MSFLEQLTASHGGPITEALARHLDLPVEDADRILARIVPLVLGGLARQLETRGPEAVAKILNDHSDESALTETVEFLDRQAQSTDPLGGLGSLLGGGGLFGAGGGLASLFGGTVANLVTKALGGYLEIEPAKAAKVLPMLAPLIMTSLRAQAPAEGAPEIARILQEQGDSAALEELAGKILGGGGGGLGGLFRGAS